MLGRALRHGGGLRRLSSAARDVKSTFFNASHLKALDERTVAEAEHVAEAEKQSICDLAFAIQWLDASHLTSVAGASRDERIFDQTLNGHEAAFAAVADCWQREGHLERLVEAGAVDLEVAEQLQAVLQSSQHAERSLLQRHDPPSAEIILCNTTRGMSPTGEVQYVAVVRYEPSPRDALRGLQAMWYTYVASAHGRGPELLEWLNEAMHRGGEARAGREGAVPMPLRWRLADVNFVRYGPPERRDLLGAAKPVFDELARLVTPYVVIGVALLGGCAIWLTGPEPVLQPPRVNRLLQKALRGGARAGEQHAQLWPDGPVVDVSSVSPPRVGGERVYLYGM